MPQLKEYKPERISPKLVMKLQGFTKEDLHECIENGMAPACCSDLCFTDIDGSCKHGHPSIVVALGYI